MGEQNKNLILATALSFLVILVWYAIFPPEPVEELAQTPPQEATEQGAPSETGPLQPIATESAGGQTAQTVDDVADAPRLTIDTPRLQGSVSLAGGRIDELFLQDYRTELDPEADTVQLLTPQGQTGAFYAAYGWAAGEGLGADMVPGFKTLWGQVGDNTLTPQTPVTLQWDNGAGLIFERVIAVDADFMFTVTQTVRNTSAGSVSLTPYALLARHGLPEDAGKNNWLVHEGAMIQGQKERFDIDWDDLPTPASRAEEAVNDAQWAGFTDHFWQSILVADTGKPFRVEAFVDERLGIYQLSARQQKQSVAPGQSLSITTRLFAGAKEWEAIRHYQNDPSFLERLFGLKQDPERPVVKNFIDSIDWGWFFFLTKPIFWLLHELNALIGNMGWAIIGLTLTIKALLLPLAFKSYVSMAKMKELQPEMQKLKERAGDDRQKLQQEMMALYKKEKVNPAAGCLPILLQIPIFFSLYKVILVTIELRHAPWLGPFQDLSAPDPTSIINLFGLLPFASPDPNSILSLIFIGILPLILGISMWLQQKLNPAPTDPTQQMIFAWMPWIFMFMLGSFASGLVVYWIANNVITFAQQYLIMRSQGYTPDLFGNISSSFKRKPKGDK